MPNRVGGQGSRNSGNSMLSKPVDYVTGLFWGLINFVVVFFSTMLNLAPPKATTRQGGRTGGPGWGNGGSGGGGGGGGRNVRGMSDVKPKSGPKMNVGGGG